MKILNLILALPFLLAMGVGLHVYCARAIKAVLWAWSPLPRGEPESFRYERSVYATSDPKLLQIIGVAAAAGLFFWGGLIRSSTGLWFTGFLVVAAAVALDVLRWERVASSASCLWYQRGFGSTVHQVAIENILDVEVEENEVRGFTLRRGSRNQSVGLKVRMLDHRFVELPKTDAYTALDDVEAVANHLRMRMQRLGGAARQTAQPEPPMSEPVRPVRETVAPPPPPAPPEDDAELRRALKQLRKKAQSPSESHIVKKVRNSRSSSF